MGCFRIIPLSFSITLTITEFTDPLYDPFSEKEKVLIFSWFYLICCITLLTEILLQIMPALLQQFHIH